MASSRMEQIANCELRIASCESSLFVLLFIVLASFVVRVVVWLLAISDVVDYTLWWRNAKLGVAREWIWIELIVYDYYC